jgi:hypothetical protein
VLSTMIAAALIRVSATRGRLSLEVVVVTVR